MWNDINKKVCSLINNTELSKYVVKVPNFLSYLSLEACATINKVPPPNEVGRDKGRIRLIWNLPPDITYQVVIKNDNTGVAIIKENNKTVSKSEICWDSI